jgi:hypothetical protein
MSPLGSLQPLFRCAVCTVVPDAVDLDENGWTEVEALVEDSLRRRPAALRRRLRLFLRAVQFLSLLSFGRTFTSLDATRRERLFGRLQDHPLRLVRVGFWGLRTLAFLGYYGRPAAAQLIGYRPNPNGWEALR